MRLKYFVLKPGGDKPQARAARTAMRVYATEIESIEPQIAAEIKQWCYEEDRASHLRTLPDEKSTDN